MPVSLPSVVAERLRNQHISHPVRGEPATIVHWLGAVQAQDYAGAKWALGLRLRDITDDDVEHAFSTGAILRTHLLRPTWHFVVPGDIRWMLALTAPRIAAANAHMCRRMGLDAAIFRRSHDTIIAALKGGRQRTREELATALRDAGIKTEGDQRMAYLMMQAELDGVVCSGPRRGKQFTYALLEERVPPAKTLDRSEALAELARRFFMSRGPATAHDFAKWGGLTVADARRGAEAASDGLRHEELNGRDHWSALERPRARGRASTAHLLSIYDECISGYRDHSAMISPAHGARLMGMGNAATNVLMLDGRIVGAWRRTVGRDIITAEINPFIRLNGTQAKAVRDAARRYGEFFGQEVVVTSIAARRGGAT